MRNLFKPLAALAFILLFAANDSFAQFRTDSDYSSLYDSETVAALREHIRFISSAAMEGRKPGSEGEYETAKYITEILESYDIDVISGEAGDVFGLKGETDTLTSRNVVAYIPGYDKALRDHYIVIGARMDNLGVLDINIDGQKHERIMYGANGNASGVATLLELARMLKTNQVLMRRSVLLIGFGASSMMEAGSWYFLNRSFKDVEKIDAMINLDILGCGASGFYAFTSSNPDMNAQLDAQARELQPIVPTLTAKEPFASDHRSFYEKEIPSVLFTTGSYPEYNTDKDTESIIDYDTMERELEYIFNYTLATINGPRPIFNASSELKKRVADDNVFAYYDCDVRPSFLGSADPKVFLERWVYQYIKYPEECIYNGIQGRVLVDFIIDEKGKVTDVKVLRGVDELLDAEAVRVVKASPDWKPGRVRGQKVKSEISLYVEFRLEKKGAKRRK
ncbi:MAG: TonB family protein [Bacteroidales bacterium]|nr:TonB family protein [Bacteroidales bacterium]